MRSFIQNNTATVLILVATVVLAGVATFTAVRLYQLRVQPISPITPQTSNAQALPTTQPPSCRLTFTLTLSSPVATSSASPSGSPLATASATPRATATSSPLALGGLSATASPTATATAKATPLATTTSMATSAPTLPNAGSTLPTLVGIAAALLLLITAFVLAL